ncbi:MAG: nucleotide sugar dehydrogenase [Candidatus Cloacimonetes bacterium]|nr:nucleotide sugar dehydrogenase [Candidatus Cloacimonadota bacterium]
MALLEKIQSKEAKVAVVGLGYVGLPMAVTVARNGYNVLGFDILQKRADQIKRGENYIGDVDSEELKELVEKGLISATTDYSLIKDMDVIMVAVPTPLDKYKQPDSSYVISSTKSIAEHIKKDTLLVLESTTYPGTTREIVAPEIEKRGFVVGRDIFVAFSPERVDPGNKDYKTDNTPKVVGGMTEECNRISGVFYKTILTAPVFLVSSPEVAEMEKIYENTFRNINIALANEMTILCEKMGIDIWEVIEAASTKPYGFMPFYPGPGIGGHCIPLDPFYLTWKAREFNYHTRLIELAGEINNSMPDFVVGKAASILNKRGIALSKAKILLIGAAYKKDIDDIRESPVQMVIHLFEKQGCYPDYNDPFIPSFVNEINHKHYQSVDLDKIGEYDLVVITTNHAIYDYNDIVNRAKLILDTRLATNGMKLEKIIRL